MLLVAGRKRQGSFRRPPADAGGQADLSGPGSDGFDSLFSTQDVGKAKNFKVVVRVRPLNRTERDAGEESVVHVDGSNVINLIEPNKASSGADLDRPDSRAGRRSGPRTFSYDWVFNETDSQEQLYGQAVRPVVLSTLDGYNGSIIAYGQTGTGKTHTIEGGDGEDRGVIARATEDIFNHIRERTTDEVKFLCRVSFLQIYNEQITDLLDEDVGKRPSTAARAISPPEDRLNIREDTDGSVYVDGLKEVIIASPEETLEHLRKGSERRTTASTNMNSTSSRSHAVFTITTEMSEPDGAEGQKVTVGKLCLVDLAGSERIKSTGITLSDGKRMDEAKNINSSLTAFGKVVLALTSGGNHHVPYRDSKLTRILQGSVGGNCKTTMITTIGPSGSAYAESTSSLKFATRAKKIKNYAVVNQNMTDKAMLAEYAREIARLKSQMRSSVSSASMEIVETLQRRNTELVSEAQQEYQQRLQQERQLKTERKEREALAAKIRELEERDAEFGRDQSELYQTAVEEATKSLRPRLEREFEKLTRSLQSEKDQLKQERDALQNERALFEQEKKKLERERQILEEMRTELTDVAPPTLAGHPASPPQTVSPPRSPHNDREENYFSPQSHEVKSPPGRNLGRHNSVHTAFQNESRVEVSEDEPIERANDEMLDFEVYLHALQHPETGIPLHDARLNHTYYRGVFTGEHAAIWFNENMEGVDTLDIATVIGQKFVSWGCIAALDGTSEFHADSRCLYQFVDNSRVRPKTAVRVTTSQEMVDNSVTSPPQRPVTASRPRTSQGSGGSSRRPLRPKTPSSSRPSTASRFRRAMRKVATIQNAAGAPGGDNEVSADAPRLPRRMSVSRGGRPGTADVSSDAGATLLHSAAGQGDRTAIKSFLSTFDVDCTDNFGRTPLMYACTANKVKGADLLIRQGASLTAEDADGRTALLWAAYYGHHDVVRLLLRTQQSIVTHAGPDGRSALHWATKQPSSRCLEILLRNAPPGFVDHKDCDAQTALHWAVLCKADDHVQKLLRSNASIEVADDSGRTPLHYAVVNLADTCLVTLLEAAPEAINIADDKGRTCLHLAVGQEGASSLALQIMRHQATDVGAVDARGTSALHWAAVCDRRNLCKALVARGANLQLRDSSGMTPLHHAATKGLTQTVEVLQRLQASGH